MMNLLSLLLTLLLAVPVYSQTGPNTLSDSSDIVKTKDGIILGKKSDLIKSFSRSVSDFKKMEQAGVTFDTTNFYECVITAIQSLDNQVIQKKDTVQSIVKTCFFSSMKLNLEEKLGKIILIKLCKDSMIIKNDLSRKIGLESSESIDSYCECFADKIMTVEKSKRQEYINGDINNILVFPCIQLAQSKARQNNDIYNPNDIIGSVDSSNIKLLKIGDHKMVQITIGDITKYYILDTGSDLLLIDKISEQELINNKKLLPSMFIGEKQFSLADNRKVNAKVYNIDKVSIGSYTVKNVEIGVIENGALLCGMSLLQKFRHWKIDSEINVLKLFK